MTAAPAATTGSASAQDAGRRARRARRGTILAAALGLLMVAAVVYLSHPAQILPTVRRLGPAAFAEVLLLNLPVIGLRAWRAGVVLRHLGHRVPAGRQLAVQLVGQTSSALTPAASGDFVRAWLWRRDDGVPLSAGGAVVVFERLFSFGLLLVLAVLLVSFPRFGLGGWLVVALGLVAATLAPYLLSRRTPHLDRRLESWLGRLPRVGGASSRLVHALGRLRTILASPAVLAKASAATIVIYACTGFQLWILVSALGHRAPITQMVATSAISQAGGIVSTLPFGIGPADLLTVGAMARYGISVSLAAVVALLTRVLTTVPMAIAALPAYLLLGRPELDASAAAAAEDEA